MATNQTNTLQVSTARAAKKSNVSKTVPKLSDKAMADITSVANIVPEPISKEATLRELGIMIRDFSLLRKWGHPVRLFCFSQYPFLQIADIKIEVDPFSPDGYPPRFTVEVNDIRLTFAEGMEATELLRYIDNIAAFNEARYTTNTWVFGEIEKR